MKILPILFIADEGSVFPYLQAVGIGTREYLFSLEPDFEYERSGRKFRGAHVRRYQNWEDFNSDQFNLIGHCKAWPIYFACIEVETHDLEFLIQIDELEEKLKVVQERNGHLEGAIGQSEELLRVATEEIASLKERIPPRIVDLQPDGPATGGRSDVEPDPNERPKMPTYGGDTGEEPNLEDEETAGNGELEVPPPPAGPDELPPVVPKVRRSRSK